MKNKQYEFSIEIDDYIFNRFVKNKIDKSLQDFQIYKNKFPNVKCNFILRGNKEEVYLWDISERVALKEKINSSTFTNAMRESFTYEAIQALWNYFEQYESDTGEELELDPIAFRCEFNEYSSLEEFHEEYDKEEYPTIEDIENNTTVIPFEKTEGFLIRSF